MLTADPPVWTVLLGFAAVAMLVLLAAGVREAWRWYDRRLVTALAASVQLDNGWSREALPNLYAIGWRPWQSPDFQQFDGQIGEALDRLVPYYGSEARNELS